MKFIQGFTQRNCQAFFTNHKKMNNYQNIINNKVGKGHKVFSYHTKLYNNAQMINPAGNSKIRLLTSEGCCHTSKLLFINCLSNYKKTCHFYL